jgi:hypothetical protein
MLEFLSKHRWLKFIAISISLIILISLIGFSYEKITTHLKNEPKVMTEFVNIKLNQSFEDFMFRNPGFTIDKSTDNKENENETDYIRKIDSPTQYTSITIRDNKVLRIFYQCQDSYDQTSINGIDCYASGDMILNKFNDLVNVQCLKDKTNEMYFSLRVYDVEKYGVRYHLVSNKVLAFSIYPSNEFKKFRWTKCI